MPNLFKESLSEWRSQRDDKRREEQREETFESKQAKNQERQDLVDGFRQLKADHAAVMGWIKELQARNIDVMHLVKQLTQMIDEEEVRPELSIGFKTFFPQVFNPLFSSEHKNELRRDCFRYHTQEVSPAKWWMLKKTNVHTFKYLISHRKIQYASELDTRGNGKEVMPNFYLSEISITLPIQVVKTNSGDYHYFGFEIIISPQGVTLNGQDVTQFDKKAWVDALAAPVVNPDLLFHYHTENPDDNRFYA